MMARTSTTIRVPICRATIAVVYIKPPTYCERYGPTPIAKRIILTRAGSAIAPLGTSMPRCMPLNRRFMTWRPAADACRRLRFLLHNLLRKLGELRQIHVLGRDLEHIVGGCRNGPRGPARRGCAGAGFGRRRLGQRLRRRYRARASSRCRGPNPLLHLFHPALVAVEGPHALLAAGLEYVGYLAEIPGPNRPLGARTRKQDFTARDS